MKRTVPLMIVLVGGVLMMIQYFIPHRISQSVFDSYTTWIPIIGAFALILGVGSLTRLHGHKVRHRAPNWPYSLAVILSIYLMLVFALLLPVSVGGGMNSPSVFDFAFMHILVPIQSTMFSLLAFYIASAAFRAFRAKSLLATVLLLTAVVVMIGQVPIGELLGSWFPKLGLWIIDFPNNAAKRAIGLGVGFGILATQLKIIFGVERNWLGGVGD